MVELGCGVGLPSLVCAAMGARVIATDLPKALEVRSKSLTFLNITHAFSFQCFTMGFFWFHDALMLYVHLAQRQILRMYELHSWLTES